MSGDELTAWLKAKIIEHKAAATQAQANANAHAGAQQAYEALLVELNTRPQAGAQQ